MARNGAFAARLEGDTEVANLLPQPRTESVTHGRWAFISLWAGVLCLACIATVLAAAGRSPRDLGSPEQATLQNVIGADVTPSPGLYSVYTNALKGAKYIDLTHAFSPDTSVWPGFGPAKFGAGISASDMDGFVKKGQEFTYAKHGFQTGTYTIATDQYGTQLDPPAHWNERGATISDLPATFAVRPLVVLDVHAAVQQNKSYHANVSDATTWESKYGQIPEGSVVMIRSDWSKGWHSYTKDGLPAEYAGVGLDLLKFLHNKRKILFHGHEPLDTDMTPSMEGEAWLMHNNFAQAEGVTNLDQVPEHGCLISIGFAKPLGGLGGFARYVAICPADTPGGVSVEDAPGAPLPQQPHPLRRGTHGVLVPNASAKATEYCSSTGSLGCIDGRPVWK